MVPIDWILNNWDGETDEERGGNDLRDIGESSVGPQPDRDERRIIGTSSHNGGNGVAKVYENKGDGNNSLASKADRNYS